MRIPTEKEYLSIKDSPDLVQPKILFKGEVIPVPSKFVRISQAVKMLDGCPHQLGFKAKYPAGPIPILHEVEEGGKKVLLDLEGERARLFSIIVREDKKLVDLKKAGASASAIDTQQKKVDALDVQLRAATARADKTSTTVARAKKDIRAVKDDKLKSTIATGRGDIIHDYCRLVGMSGSKLPTGADVGRIAKAIERDGGSVQVFEFEIWGRYKDLLFCGHSDHFELQRDVGVNFLEDWKSSRKPKVYPSHIAQLSFYAYFLARIFSVGTFPCRIRVFQGDEALTEATKMYRKCLPESFIELPVKAFEERIFDMGNIESIKRIEGKIEQVYKFYTAQIPCFPDTGPLCGFCEFRAMCEDGPEVAS